MTKVRVQINRGEFEKKKKELLESIGMKISNRAKEICAREAFDKGELTSSIGYEVNLQESKVTIGSSSPHALPTEYGTGYRGQTGYKQYFDEEKPKFTIPIVIEPKEKKALRWVEGGKERFAKRVETKGKKPVAFLRRSLFEGEEDIKQSVKDVFR